MNPGRTTLLVLSSLIVFALLGGGVLLRVGAAEGSPGQAVLFADVLGLVLDHYVDPVEAEHLVHGAYEGMLGGIDANGAYLTAEEVARWRGEAAGDRTGVGIVVLKSGRTLQVVNVESGSAADGAGVQVGDHVRTVDDESVQNLSLEQSRRLIEGEAGSTVRIELLRSGEGFRPEELELVRHAKRTRPYDLTVREGIAILSVSDLERLVVADLAEELDDAASRGVERLLLDLRNLAAGGPRSASDLSGLFAAGPILELKNRAGKVLDTVSRGDTALRWRGSIAMLVNGATAGGAEALAAIARERAETEIFGEETYGLGAEVRLFELSNGAGLLLSGALWSTTGGSSWNVDGVDPDRVVHGEGQDLEEVQEDQLARVLKLLEEDTVSAERREAA